MSTTLRSTRSASTAVSTSPKSKKRRKSSMRGLLTLLVGAVVALTFLFPFAWSVFISFGISPGGQAQVVPQQFGWDNYARLVDYGSGILTYLGNTALVATLSVAFTLAVAIPAGYAFARFAFPGRALLFFAILAVIMVPHASLLVPMYTLLAKVGGTNSLVVLALIYATFQLPFAVYMMRNSFESIPRELDESALVDGCGPIRALWSVLLPIVVPGIVTVALFAFLAAWNEFLAPLIFLTSDDKFTLPIALSSVSVGEMGSVDYGALQAGITVSVLPCIIIFVALQKYYVNGLISGALKG